MLFELEYKAGTVRKTAAVAGVCDRSAVLQQFTGIFHATFHQIIMNTFACVMTEGWVK